MSKVPEKTRELRLPSSLILWIALLNATVTEKNGQLIENRRPALRLTGASSWLMIITILVLV